MVVSLSIVPIGMAVELAEELARVLEVIDRSGLPYRLTAMSTEIEGDWDEVMPVIREAHEVARSFSGRTLTHIAIDDRAGATDRLEGKVRAVEEIVGRRLGRDR
jgi:uncharacterized protein (TIGR00106 family)